MSKLQNSSSGTPNGNALLLRRGLKPASRVAPDILLTPGLEELLSPGTWYSYSVDDTRSRDSEPEIHAARGEFSHIKLAALARQPTLRGLKSL